MARTENFSNFSVTSTPKSTHFDINIKGPLESHTDIDDILYALRSAGENDSVDIHLNSVGGDVLILAEIVKAMNRCACPIHVTAAGIVASAATIILLEADSIEVEPFTEILFHPMSYGLGGKMQEVKAQVDYVHEMSMGMMKHYYSGFFTDQEIEAMVEHNREFYMKHDEFITRYEARNAALQEAAEELSIN